MFLTHWLINRLCLAKWNLACVARVRMVWWRWCSDDDGVGERDKWVFDVADSPISPTRSWRLKLRSWPVCRSRLNSRDHFARNPWNAVNLLWTLVHLSSGPPFPYLLTSNLYAVFIIHFNKRCFSLYGRFWIEFKCFIL